MPPLFDQPNHLTNNPPGTVPVDADKLEANFNYIIGLLNTGLPTGALAAAVAQALAGPGVIQMIAYDSADPGWLLCDGSAVSRTGATAALFAKIGTKYGAGDGSTTFNLPDGRGRMPVGKGTIAAVDTLGKSDGLGVGSRQPSHAHGLGGHTHTHDHIHNVSTLFSTVGPNGETNIGPQPPGGFGFDVIVPVAGHTHAAGFNINSGGAFGTVTSGPSGGSDAGGPGYVVVNHQIKL